MVFRIERLITKEKVANEENHKEEIGEAQIKE